MQLSKAFTQNVDETRQKTHVAEREIAAKRK